VSAPTAGRSWGARAAVLACLAASAACGPRGDSARQPTLWKDTHQRRQFITQHWDTLWTVGGSEQDSLLLRPYLLSAAEGAVYVFDAAAKRVVAFGDDGKLRWTLGSNGAGPSEFRGARDLKASPEGIFVLDPRNNRIARLGADGTWRGAVPLTAAGHAEQMAPLDGSGFVLLTMNPDSAFVEVDSSGSVLRRFSLPWEGFSRLDALARQGYIAAENGQWVFGFSIGDGWFAYDRARPSGEPRAYVEHTEFPEVAKEQAPQGASTKLTEYNACSACSMSMDGNTLNVHFGGYTGAPGKRYLDRFNVRSGKYLGSYVLPASAQVVEVEGDRVYVLAEDPYPILLALRPRLAPR